MISAVEVDLQVVGDVRPHESSTLAGDTRTPSTIRARCPIIISLVAPRMGVPRVSIAIQPVRLIPA